MRLIKRTLPALAMLWGATAAAQSVISARTALVQYVEGRVLLTHRPERPKSKLLQQLADRDVLNTESGRAEVLLNPSVLLRLDEHSSMRLLSGRIADSSVELLSGRFILEASEVHRSQPVTLTCRGATIALMKPGVYRVDAEPARVRVFGGQVLVQREGRRMTVGRGRELPLDRTWIRGKFNRALADAFDLWSRHRSELLIMAAARASRNAPLGQSRDGWSVSLQPPRSFLSK